MLELLAVVGQLQLLSARVGHLLAALELLVVVGHLERLDALTEHL